MLNSFVITLDFNTVTIRTLQLQHLHLPGHLLRSFLLQREGNERLLLYRLTSRIGFLELHEPVVIHCFILAARLCRLPPTGRKNITQAPAITVLVVVLHHFLKILSCLHNQLKFEFGDRSALPLIRATRVLRKVYHFIFSCNTSKLPAYTTYSKLLQHNSHP